VVRHPDRIRAAEAVRLAEDQQLDAGAIAGRVGVHERTVRRWLSNAGVPQRPGPRRTAARRPGRAPLSADAAQALRAAWDALPAPTRGGAGHDLTGEEGRAVIAAMTAHRRAGVTAASLGRALGVSGQYVRRITSTKASDE
jgi:predicted transcriptional regulator